MLTTTGEFEAGVLPLATLLLDCTALGRPTRAGVTLQREAWRGVAEFTLFSFRLDLDLVSGWEFYLFMMYLRMLMPENKL